MKICRRIEFDDADYFYFVQHKRCISSDGYKIRPYGAECRLFTFDAAKAKPNCRRSTLRSDITACTNGYGGAETRPTECEFFRRLCTLCPGGGEASGAQNRNLCFGDVFPRGQICDQFVHLTKQWRNISLIKTVFYVFSVQADFLFRLANLRWADSSAFVGANVFFVIFHERTF